jgi:integrase
MGRKPTFRYQKTPRGWKVELPASISPSRERERVYHKTRDAAKEYALKLKTDYESHGSNATAIRPSLAEDAVKAAEILEPYGISLTEAAKRIQAIEEELAASSVLEKAIEEFRRQKEAMSESQVNAYGYMATDLITDFSGRKLASITGAELLTHVDAHTGGPASYNHRIRLLKAFWRWCAKLPRGWCDIRTTEVLEKKETAARPVEILTAVEARKLLSTAEQHYPDCVPAYALAMFTGLRQAELERLAPEDISDEGIRLPAISTKTGRRRFIQMPKPLAVWLKKYPIGETVLPSNWTRKDKAVRRLAGWKVWSDMVEPPEPEDSLPKWPENALRHTHASTMVVLGKPLDDLTFEFGHSGGAAVLKSHYVGVMPRSEAEKIWSIGPHGTTIPLGEESPRPLAKQARTPKKKKTT